MKQLGWAALFGILLAAPSALAEETCALEKNIGLEDADAAGVTEVLCAPVRADPVTYPLRYGVRVVKVGSKIVLTLVQHAPNGSATEKQIIVASLEETTVAAPRLLEAIADSKTVEDTVDVTNVVAEEARVPKARPAAVHAWMGMIGAGHVHGFSGGVLVGIAAGSERWSFVGDLRVAGESFLKPASLAAAIFTLGMIEVSPEARFDYISLSAGARHHFSASDVAPFLGAGLGLDAIGYGTERVRPSANAYAYAYPSRSKSAAGLAGYAEVGLDVLRTHRVGGAFVVRGDLPTFAVARTTSSTNDPTNVIETRRYLPVLSAGVVMRF